MKKAAIDFSTSTDHEICWAIISKVTTQSALYGFIQRVGTNKKNTKSALEMLRLHKLEQKRNARSRQAIKTILQPVNSQIRNGEEITDIFSDVINGWICLYRDKIGIALSDQQVLALILSESREELKKYGIDPERHRNP